MKYLILVAFAVMFVLLSYRPASAANRVVLEFVQRGCQPCAEMRPLVKQFVNAGFDIRETDIDAYPDLVDRYKPSITPTFVVIDDTKDGQEIGRGEGKMGSNEFKALMDLYEVTPKPRK